MTANRRTFLFGAAAALSVAGAPFPAAPAVLRGRGDFRGLSLINDRTGEWIKTVYWVEGEYIPEALEAANHILRDWRAERATRMDPAVLDILSATHRMLDTEEPFEIVSGYRTTDTNRMLRSRSRAVAKKSYHMRGMAVDIAMKTRSVRQISGAGMSLRAGGVGKYSRSKFVHLDSGPVRDWGR